METNNSEKMGFELGQPVNELNIDIVEKLIIEKVNKTISTLESAIASWENAKTKPEDLKPKFTKYKKLHAALSEWEKIEIQMINRKASFMDRVQRLQTFVDICYANA